MALRSPRYFEKLFLPLNFSCFEAHSFPIYINCTNGGRKQFCRSDDFFFFWAIWGPLFCQAMLRLSSTSERSSWSNWAIEMPGWEAELLCGPDCWTRACCRGERWAHGPSRWESNDVTGKLARNFEWSAAGVSNFIVDRSYHESYSHAQCTSHGCSFRDLEELKRS